MSEVNTNGAASGTAIMSARAKDAAAQLVPAGKRAGTAAVLGVRQGVQGAREWATPRVIVAVLSARQWAAPRLDSAADAVTESVAPKVSTMLRSAARQVRPEEITPAETETRSLLDWRWLLGLGAVVAAAAGTAAVAMRRRYASATAEAKEATEAPAEEGGQDGESADETVRSEVNGQVTTPGR